jgi:hypothetical protein
MRRWHYEFQAATRIKYSAEMSRDKFKLRTVCMTSIQTFEHLSWQMDLSDIEIDNICAGYVQSAAKVRFLRSMGLVVRRKPNGRPLVNRTHYDAAMCGSGSVIDISKSDNQPVWGVH